MFVSECIASVRGGFMHSLVCLMNSGCRLTELPEQCVFVQLLAGLLEAKTQLN